MRLSKLRFFPITQYHKKNYLFEFNCGLIFLFTFSEDESAEENPASKRGNTLEALKSIERMIQIYRRLQNGDEIKKTYTYLECKLDATFSKKIKMVKLKIQDNPANNAQCANAALLNIAQLADVLVNNNQKKNEDGTGRL